MKIKSKIKQYFGLDDLIALLFLFLGVLYYFFPLKFRFLSSFHTNIIEIGITVLIIGNASQFVSIRSDKNRLILQMGSPVNGFAIEAIRQMRAMGWLIDGTASNKNFTDANWSKAYLVQADLNNADIMYANLSFADLTQANLKETALDFSNLSSANLYKAKLNSAHLVYVDFRNANLTEADCSNAELNGADLSTATLKDIVLRGCLFDENTKWPPGFNAKKHGAIFKKIDPMSVG